MRLLFVLFLLSSSVLPAQSQFHDLATTDDGRQLYFSSPLRQPGTSQFGYDKVFRLVDTGFQLFAMQEQTSTSLPQSNFYLLGDPDVSGDGDVVSYVARRTCYGGSSCVFVELYESHILGSGAQFPMVFAGRTRLSRNKRYAVQFGSTGFMDRGTKLVDLITGERIAIPGTILGSGRQAITSDGTVLTFDNSNPNGLTLWNTGGTQRVNTGVTPGAALINDAKTWVIYEESSAPDGPRRLYSIKLASGIPNVLAAGATESYQASITDDGRLLSYVMSPAGSAPRQVFVSSPDGSGRRQLTDVPEGISEAVLAGYGTVVYAATNDGRLLRIDVASGSIQELAGRTPLVTDRLGGAAPGSLNWIRGFALSATTEVSQPPLPGTLGGAQVMFGGKPARLLLVSPGEIRFQIPFDVQPGDTTLEVLPRGQVFEQVPMPVTVQAQEPRFLRHGYEIPITPENPFPYLPVMAHPDFSALVSPASPARPGEIVVFYMTGLGAVTPPVASGDAAPSNPPAAAVAGLHCDALHLDTRTPLAVPFAGLAPGFVGVYQVNIQMPAQVADSSVLMECASGNSTPDVATVPVQVPAQ